MYHLIEFNKDKLLDISRGKNKQLERIKVKTGERFNVEVKPYVNSTKTDLGSVLFVELANLYVDDMVFLQVPMSIFRFCDKGE